MLILGRVYWFLNWAVITAIVAIVVLVLLRFIAQQADLNPFGWSSITIRRLTDPFIGPIRRGLMGFGVDPKYAPLVAILLMILLGWFALQVVASVFNTVAGIITSVGRHDFVPIIGYVLYGIVSLYILTIFLRIILSWGMASYSNRIMRFLVNSTEPLLGPLRHRVPMVGNFDISPIVAFVILWVIQGAIARTLLHGLPIQFFA
ncbi:MAG TPA: YggT family protein [Pyrinomonadaceae bacterium]|nr:YggT family protein [Pyrinomonadaceae bacterium]